MIKNRAIDIVFDNKHIDKTNTPSGKDGFMQSLEDNILEPRIYDLVLRRRAGNIRLIV